MDTLDEIDKFNARVTVGTHVGADPDYFGQRAGLTEAYPSPQVTAHFMIILGARLLHTFPNEWGVHEVTPGEHGGVMTCRSAACRRHRESSGITRDQSRRRFGQNLRSQVRKRSSTNQRITRTIVGPSASRFW